MDRRRDAVLRPLTKEQYQSLLETAAAVEDREKSISSFYYLTLLGRAGLRIGEAIHAQPNWMNHETGVLTVPPHRDCACGLCRRRAQAAATGEDSRSFEDVLADFWTAKSGAHRDIPLETERATEIVNLYFSELSSDSPSYMSTLRQIKRVAELTEGVKATAIYGHTLQATAATHYLWAGARLSALEKKHGWVNEKTKGRYFSETGLESMQESRRVRGKSSTTEFTLPESPPTYTELRPDASANRIDVGCWTPECEVPATPLYRDDEAWLQSVATNDADRTTHR
ncbi:tyrosine-type recombinase/integrase [Haloarcula sp. Atlit-7R]|uniref:tyrosine-type recombinase/integrase n=1 Tax=Haloarcula sp. Atlit-7R TaxID=2282125 RepID=UPI000EF14008|nr:hypothetical protein D3D01_16125 [Haloarcula sp. Atlit-7R]